MIVEVLGVKFLSESTSAVIRRVKQGGLLVVPSGPGMASIDVDQPYAEAVRGADYAIADSGFMVLCLKLLRTRAPKRLSGLALIRALLNEDFFLRDSKVLWVLPSENMVRTTTKLLEDHKAKSSKHSYVVAPMYSHSGAIMDTDLLEFCNKEKFEWVVLAIAGGKQEKLGYFLKENLHITPTIICIGAAIAFETGDQTSIPAWADTLYLGWFFRIKSAPLSYIPRYFYALRLLPLIALSKWRS